MAFKSIQSSFIYKHLNQNDVLTKNIVNLTHKGRLLTIQDLEEAFMVINKNFKFPLKYRVLDAVNDGTLQLRYNSDNRKMPTCMPFFLTKENDRIISVISIDLYGHENKDNKNISIDPKKLYCLLEAAYIAQICFKHSSQLSTRNIIITNGSAIYSNLFTKVLNKKYALNVDKNKMHKVLFLTSKFYMINILGLQDNESVFNYSIKNCLNANPYSIKEVNEQFKAEDYEDLSKFILALSNSNNGLGFKDLTVRSYLESFINMYDASALLSLESFPYFLYNVISVLNGAYINNQYAMEDIVERHGSKLYTEIINLQ
jgi:hypothetical protein